MKLNPNSAITFNNKKGISAIRKSWHPLSTAIRCVLTTLIQNMKHCYLTSQSHKFWHLHVYILYSLSEDRDMHYSTAVLITHYK